MSVVAVVAPSDDFLSEDELSDDNFSPSPLLLPDFLPPSPPPDASSSSPSVPKYSLQMCNRDCILRTLPVPEKGEEEDEEEEEAEEEERVCRERL